MKNIIIVDEFLNSSELSLINDFLHNFNYQYGHQSGNRDRFLPEFFVNYVYDYNQSHSLLQKLDFFTYKLLFETIKDTL
jgi:hypothetical protein